MFVIDNSEKKSIKTDDIMEDETTKFLSDIATTPDAWLIKAVHLFDSAEVIFNKSTRLYHEKYEKIIENHESPSLEDATNFLQVGLLLAGYGFELIMKYAYIRENIKSVRSEILNKKKIPEKLLTHNLTDLSEEIGYSIKLKNKKPHLQKFLNKLSVHTIWAGRYPIPKSSSIFDDAIGNLIWSEADIEKYYELRDHIFVFLDLDYYQLKNLGIGLSS